MINDAEREFWKLFLDARDDVVVDVDTVTLVTAIVNFLERCASATTIIEESAQGEIEPLRGAGLPTPNRVFRTAFGIGWFASG